jgi:hypothetical protein
LHEIVVHNAATVSGNLYEAYFVVLRLVDGRLHVAFNGLETAAEPRIGTARRSQKSTFTMIPASSKQSGEISQAGTVENGKQAYVIRRSFGWSEDLQAFVENEVPSVQRNR